MKFLYSADNENLKIKDGCKFGNIELDQSFFPKIIDDFFGPQEHISLHYKKIANYLDEFVPNEEHAPHKKYKTDVVGLIIPIQHGDENEILSIGGELKKSYINRKSNGTRRAWEKVEVFQKRSDAYWEKAEYKNAVREGKEGSQRLFFTSFGFPIFEAYKHFPGHRNTPLPIGLNSPYLANEQDIKRNFKYVEGAFKVWLEDNFKK
jgi:hypothetical protein